MVVVLSEDQRLRDNRPAGEDVGEQPVTECFKHQTDLCFRGDVTVELFRCVFDVFVEFFEAFFSCPFVLHGHDGSGVDCGAVVGDFGLDAVHLEVNVHAVSDRLRIRVLRHKVLLEEPERLLRWCRRQPDEVRIEVLEDTTPHPINRTMTLVHNDEVKGFWWEVRVVLDRDRGIRCELVDPVIVLVGNLVAP